MFHITVKYKNESIKDIYGSKMTINTADNAKLIIKTPKMDTIDLTTVKSVTITDETEKQGQWLLSDTKVQCSQCGKVFSEKMITNYYQFENFCPHCGARMKPD